MNSPEPDRQMPTEPNTDAVSPAPTTSPSPTPEGTDGDYEDTASSGKTLSGESSTMLMSSGGSYLALR
jgi:hypothetical protein